MPLWIRPESSFGLIAGLPSQTTISPVVTTPPNVPADDLNSQIIDLGKPTTQGRSPYDQQALFQVAILLRPYEQQRCQEDVSAKNGWHCILLILRSFISGILSRLKKGTGNGTRCGAIPPQLRSWKQSNPLLSMR